MSGEPWRTGIDLNPYHEDIRAQRTTFDFIRAGYQWPGRDPRNHKLRRCAKYTPDAYVSPDANQLVSDDPQRDRFISTVDCGVWGGRGDETDSNAFSADTWLTRDGPGNPYYMTRVHSAQLSIRWTGFLSPLESGYYAFVINASDGVRVFLDGVMLDKWVWYVAHRSIRADRNQRRKRD